MAADPAFAVAGAVTVNTTVDVTAGHSPVGSLVVKVNVTVPVVPAVGVNVIVFGVDVCAVELSCEELFVIVPVTDVMLQAPVVADPPTLEPDKVYADPEHNVAADPAFAVAGAVTVKTTVVAATEQPPTPSGSFVVNVKVIDPVFPAIGVNVTVFGADV